MTLRHLQTVANAHSYMQQIDALNWRENGLSAVDLGQSDYYDVEDAAVADQVAHLHH